MIHLQMISVCYVLSSALREWKSDIPQLWDFLVDRLAGRLSRRRLPLVPAVLWHRVLRRPEPAENQGKG